MAVAWSGLLDPNRGDSPRCPRPLPPRLRPESGLSATAAWGQDPPDAEVLAIWGRTGAVGQNRKFDTPKCRTQSCHSMLGLNSLQREWPSLVPFHRSSPVIRDVEPQTNPGVRRSRGLAPFILGYIILLLATLLYGSLVFLSAVGFREPIPGVSTGPWEFVRHVIFTPGFFPWLTTASWVAALHFGGSVPKGIGFIGLAIIVHYIVFAISAHDDRLYPWIQGVEAAIAGYFLWSMIRLIPKPTDRVA